MNKKSIYKEYIYIYELKEILYKYHNSYTITYNLVILLTRKALQNK